MREARTGIETVRKNRSNAEKIGREQSGRKQKDNLRKDKEPIPHNHHLAVIAAQNKDSAAQAEQAAISFFRVSGNLRLA